MSAAGETAAAPSAPAPIPLTGTILLVDDVAENVEVLSRRLTTRGFKILSARNGATALNFVASDALDLVLLDVMMPGLSGLDVLRAIRSKFSLSELPVMMVSARDDQAMMVHCFAAGANDYMTKPVDFGLMLARLVVHVRMKQAYAQAIARAA